VVEIAQVDTRAAVKANIRILAFVVVDALCGAQASLPIGTTKTKSKGKEIK
jgi:hypothetical protein